MPIINNIPKYISDWHDYVEREPQKHCNDIKLLKEMIESLMKDDSIFYDNTDVETFIDFCKMNKHKEGRWAGESFELTIEQKYIAACIFGFKTFDVELTLNVRYFRELVLFCCRKWGKSFFLGAVAAYMLILDGEAGAQVWCLATQKTQAGLVYENTKNFLINNETLRKYVKTKRDKDNAEMLLFPATNSYMKAGSKNSKGQEGLNPSCYIVDEAALITDRNTYDVFSSACGARTQPLGVVISTFGNVREGIFDSILERCIKRLNNKSNERLFPMIFRLDIDDDYMDESKWVKANPGINEARPTYSYIRGELQKAIEDPAQLPSFLNRHMNIATNSSVIYFNLKQVDACAIEMDDKILVNKYAAGAADLAETTDLVCASALLPIYKKLYLFQKYFIASQRIELNSKSDKMAYQSFQYTNASDPLNRELLQICDGSLVSRKHIVQWFVDLRDKYDVTFWKIGADRWHFSDFADDMALVGFPRENSEGRGILFEVAWGAKTLSQPMKETKVLFDDKILQFSRHNGLFRWCTTNTAASIDPNKNIRPDKAHSKGRIDGYSSYLMAYIAFKKCEDLFLEYQDFKIN